MRNFRNQLVSALLGMGLCFCASIAAGQSSTKIPATIQRISMLAGNGLELEIAASGPLTPRSQVITSPDRVVIDFPNASPAKGLRNLEINRGDVTDARVGLFASNPPVTRIVLDLKSPQAYQIFPSGNTVVVKFAANPVTPSESDSLETIVSIERSPVAANLHPTTPAPQAMGTAPAKAVVPVEVSFENGLLSIRSNKANLSDVLAEIHRRTGADIAIPAGAESEQVFTSLGPGAPKEVLAALLNGSHFNFIVIGSERDPGGIRQVVLTPKQGGVPDAVVYPCGSAQPAVSQSVPDQGQQQAFAPPPPPPQQPDPNDGAPPVAEQQPPPQQE